MILGSPVEGEQVQAEREAKLTGPETIVGRELSRTKFENLNPEEAARVAGEAFPSVVEESAGGLPKLPAGASVVGYPADNVAQLVLGEGKHGVIESTAPIAVEDSSGQRVPVDLGLDEVGGGFEPRTPLVAVRVAKRLSGGVSLPGTGVSLTPVDAQGSSLGGSEGQSDGASVFFGETGVDSGTIVKPTATGFAVDTVLFSQRSSGVLFFRVGLPEGASLVQEGGSGGVRVVKEGVTLAMIPAPGAQDAEGTRVPVSTAIVSGDVLSLTVAPFAGEYRLPIVVDPTVEDTWFSGGKTYYRSNWHFERGPYPEGAAFTAPFQPEGGSWTESISGSHNENEWGGLFYTTQGESQITSASVTGHWSDTGSHIQNYMVLYTKSFPYTEAYSALPVEAKERERGEGGKVCAPAELCSETTVGSAPAENHNTVAYEQESTGAGGGVGGSNTLTSAYVQIFQAKGPELEFNKTSPTIYDKETHEYLPNVMYGSGSWLGPHSGAFEVRAKDPGLGLSYYRVLGGGYEDQKYNYALGDCVGVQCPEYDYQEYTYKTGMVDGEENFEAQADDPAGLFAHIEPYGNKIKIDGTPPHNIKVTGFQNGNELPLKETHIKVEATDGSGTTKSSGVRSIKVSVDGHEVLGSAASCPEGPCSASTEITLAADEYASGEHSLVVTATDNAGNVAQEEFLFRVHGASPVAVGPGSVEPELRAVDAERDGRLARRRERCVAHVSVA